MGNAPSWNLDITAKRQLLFSVRIRFSPHTQPIRETAIDKIIEQNLVLADKAGLSIQEIEQSSALCFLNDATSVSRTELEEGLGRLRQNGRVLLLPGDPQDRFRLSDAAEKEIWASAEVAEKRFQEVLGKLFRNLDRPPQEFAQPFLYCLCVIFSKLGECYVRHLKNEITEEELLRNPSVTRAVPDTAKKFRWLDPNLFLAAVYRFFQENDPAFAEIKWNMAQNYYVAKALGLDRTGRLLSREVFANGDFYLDTNVLVHALEPSTKHYKSFLALTKACKDLNITLKTCQVTIDELRRVVSFERESLAKVLDKIPDQTAGKVRGILFPIYFEKVQTDGKADLNEIFGIFDSPMPFLESQYGVERIDDNWFDAESTKPETQALVEELRKIYKGRRCRTHKRKSAALHDALVIRWIENERRTRPSTWLVTRDLSLPSYGKDSREPGHTFAITLDALLQWVSPLALGGMDEDEMAEVFSEALKHNLLPQESFFELSDFLVFAEMEWATKELPSEDVEDCIRAVKKAAPSLDPTDPSDREKLSHEIAKYFADPGRRYKQDIQTREAQLLKLQHDLETLEQERGKERDELRGQVAALQELVEQERAARTSENAKRDQETANERLKRSARWRLSIIGFLVLMLELGVIYFADRYGEGHNLWQKVLNSYKYVLLPVSAGALLGYLFVGRDRLRALGWPFNRWFKVD